MTYRNSFNMHELKTKFQIPPMLGEVKNDDKSNRSHTQIR